MEHEQYIPKAEKFTKDIAVEQEKASNPEIEIVEELTDNPEVHEFVASLPVLMEAIPLPSRNSVEKITFAVRPEHNFGRTKHEEEKFGPIKGGGGDAMGSHIRLFYPPEATFLYHEIGHTRINAVQKEYDEQISHLCESPEVQGFIARFKKYCEELGTHPVSRVRSGADFDHADIGIEQGKIVISVLYGTTEKTAHQDGGQFLRLVNQAQQYVEGECRRLTDQFGGRIPVNFIEAWRRITEEQFEDHNFQSLKDSGNVSPSILMLARSGISRYEGVNFDDWIIEQGGILDISPGLREAAEDVAEYCKYSNSKSTPQGIGLSRIRSIEELADPKNAIYPWKNIPEQLARKIASKYARKFDLLRKFGFIF